MINRLRTMNLIAFIAVLLALTSLTAHAQKPALTQNIDEKGRIPYHSSTHALCPNTQCQLIFSAVPAGYRLVVIHASLFYLASPSSSVYPSVVVLSGGANNQNESASYEEFLAISTSGGGNYIASSPVTYYVEAGGTPSMVVATTSNESSTYASISGYLINLSQ